MNDRAHHGRRGAGAHPRGSAAPIGRVETVPLARALGRTLARDLVAKRTQPPVAVSAMDGYAVRAARSRPPSRPVEADRRERRRPWIFGIALGAGETVRIFTGAPVPEGADAILIQENARAEAGSIEPLQRRRRGAAHPRRRPRFQRGRSSAARRNAAQPAGDCARGGDEPCRTAARAAPEGRHSRDRRRTDSARGAPSARIRSSLRTHSRLRRWSNGPAASLSILASRAMISTRSRAASKRRLRPNATSLRPRAAPRSAIMI